MDHIPISLMFLPTADQKPEISLILRVRTLFVAVFLVHRGMFHLSSLNAASQFSTRKIRSVTLLPNLGALKVLYAMSPITKLGEMHLKILIFPLVSRLSA